MTNSDQLSSVVKKVVDVALWSSGSSRSKSGATKGSFYPSLHPPTTSRQLHLHLILSVRGSATKAADTIIILPSGLTRLAKSNPAKGSSLDNGPVGTADMGAEPVNAALVMKT